MRTTSNLRLYLEDQGYADDQITEILDDLYNRQYDEWKDEQAMEHFQGQDYSREDRECTRN